MRPLLRTLTLVALALLGTAARTNADRVPTPPPVAVVDSAYGVPLATLPKACWPGEKLVGADTVWRFAPCRSLDVLPIGMRVQVECVLDRAKQGGFPPLVSETLRSLWRQEYLHDSGRNRPGIIVTKVRDARTGFHYWGLAVDIVHAKRGWNHPQFFHWLAIYAEGCGLVAGKYWKSFPDPPHVQFAAIESMSKAPPWAKELMQRGDRTAFHRRIGAAP